MHRRRRVADQGFGPAEADRKLEDLKRVEKLEGLPLAALDVERESSAGGAALLLEDTARRVVLGQEGREIDLGDARMLGEELGDDLGVAAGGGQSQRQSLERARDNPGRMRIEVGSHRPAPQLYPSPLPPPARPRARRWVQY